MKKLNLAVLAAMLLQATLWANAAWAAETFKVSAQVYHQGVLVASPVLVVEANKEAQVSIGDNFSFSVTLSPHRNDVVALSSTVNIAGDILYPELLMTYDKEAIIEVDAQKMVLLVSRVE